MARGVRPDLTDPPPLSTVHAAANAKLVAFAGLPAGTSSETVIPVFTKGALTTNPPGFTLGLFLGSLSQQGKVLVPSSPTDLIPALSKDISDGAFDGKDPGSPIPLGSGTLPITAGNTDLLTFLNSYAISGNAIVSNGLTANEVQPLATSLFKGVATSTATPPFAGLASGSSAALATFSFGGHQYLFIAGRTKGIVVLDVTDPLHIPTPKAWTFLFIVTFQLNFVGGVVPVVGTAAHPQLLAYAFALPHIALINAEVLATGTPGIDDSKLVDFETNLPIVNTASFSDISPLFAGGIADNGRRGVWLATGDGYEFFDLTTNAVGKIFPVDPTQKLAENMGGDIAHNILLAGNYVGMQLIDLAKQKSFDMDSTFFSSNIAALAPTETVDANSVDTGFRVGIGTGEHVRSSFFIDLARLTTNDTNSTFVPASGAFVGINLGSSTVVLDLTGPAADSTSHLVLFSGDNTADVAVGVLQDPASVPSGGTWAGLTDWVFYRVLNSPSLSTYFGSSDPHVFGSVFNAGVGRPFGYLLDSTDTFVVQVDMQGLLKLARQGTSGDAAHQPATDPATVGVLTAINIP